MNAPIEQGTPLWVRARIGCLTASRMNDARSMLKRGGETQARYKYKLELIAERLSGMAVDHYVSAAMQEGIEKEPFAVQEYEEQTGIIIFGNAQFIMHPTILWFGATPDRFIGEHGILEVKCPLIHTHTQYIISGEIPQEYQDQMLAEIACTGRKWADYVSYHPQMPEQYRLVRHHFEPTQEQIDKCEEDATMFLAEVQKLGDQLTEGVSAHKD